jgi:hypothetical protein
MIPNGKTNITNDPRYIQQKLKKGVRKKKGGSSTPLCFFELISKYSPPYASLEPPLKNIAATGNSRL